jgi:alpha-1,6-mannosyltransferase
MTLRDGLLRSGTPRTPLILQILSAPGFRSILSPPREHVKVCDLTQFYSPVSGGVKRYIAEKVRFIREQTAGDEHLLIIPGERDEVFQSDRSRVYTIRSPLISQTSRYRVLLRLGAVERILERERPDILECGDPYQVAWKAVLSGRALGIPVIGFYHSHFPEAYLRLAARFVGPIPTDFLMDLSRRYVRSLYNRFERTLVPSPALGAVLADWGVRNVATTDLGVDASVFHPQADPSGSLRAELGIPADRILLLYVGRLAQEKNTQTLFAAFRALHASHPDRFHLLIIGDGLQRAELQALRDELAAAQSVADAPPVSWISYCADPQRLAQIYRAADFFVHPGVQETFGLVTLEAQACGTPVIGIRGSYMDRIICGDQTLWARENSSAALAAAIEATAREPFKTDTSSALLHQRVTAQYSWSEVFRHLFTIYADVIDDFARRRGDCP